MMKLWVYGDAFFQQLETREIAVENSDYMNLDWTQLCKLILYEYAEYIDKSGYEEEKPTRTAGVYIEYTKIVSRCEG